MQKGKSTSETSNKAQPYTKKCNGCGGAHPRAKCPFRETVCHKCSNKDHLAKVCRSSLEKSDSTSNPETAQPDTAKSKSVKLQALSAIDKRRRHYISASLFGKSVTLQYDTGSDVTIIGKNEWSYIGSPKLSANDTVEHAGGSELDIIGKFRCTIRALGRQGETYINVASRDGINLFGLNAIDSLNLWSVPLSQLYQDNSVISSSEKHIRRVTI